jgi:hypothetical protein
MNLIFQNIHSHYSMRTKDDNICPVRDKENVLSHYSMMHEIFFLHLVDYDKI